MSQAPSQLSQYFPVRHRTPEEQRQFDALLEAKAPGFLGSIGDAIRSEWVSSFALRQMNRRFDYEGFENYSPDIEKLSHGLPPDLIPELAGATSDDDALRIRENLLEIADSRERLAAMGTLGTALRIGANILDPAAIAAFAATGGLGAATLKAGRLANFARAGLVAGATDAALTGYRATQDPELGADDVLYSAAGSMLLGGAIGLWSRAGLAKAARRLQKSIEADAVKQAGLVATPKGQVYFRDAAEKYAPKLYKELMELDADSLLAAANRTEFETEAAFAMAEGRPFQTTLSKAEVEAIQSQVESMNAVRRENLVAQIKQEIAAGERATQMGPAEKAGKPAAAPPTEGKEFKGEALGAASPESVAPEPPRGTREPGGFNLSGLPPAYWGGPAPSMKWLRFDMVGRLQGSKNTILQKLAPLTGESGLIDREKLPIPQSALEWSERRIRTETVPFYRTYLKSWSEYAKAKGASLAHPIRRTIERGKFAVEVTKAARLPRGVYTQDPHINAAADAARDFFRRVGQIGKDYGVKGFDNFELYDTYVHRIPSQARLTKLVHDFDEKSVIDMMEGAVRAGLPELAKEDPAQVAKLARGYYEVVRRIGSGSELDKLLALDQPEILARLLREADYDPKTVENIVALLKPRRPERGLIKQARRRLDLDENYVHTLADGRKIAFADLLENDIEAITHLYARQVIGESALTEIFRAASNSADDVVESVPALLQRIRDQGLLEGIDPNITKREIAKYEVLLKSLRGQSLSEHGLWYQIARTIRQLNFLSRSGQFGIAQLPDIGNIIAQTGMRASLDMMPVLGKTIKQAATGKIDDEMLDWIESVLAHGTDPLTHQVLSRFDDTGSFVQMAGGSLQTGLSHLQRFAANYSLMTPINLVLQKWAALAAIQKWVRYAGSGKLPSESRLLAMGLDRPMAERIIKAMREPGAIETVPGLTGRRAKRISLENWKDQEAASKFVVALDKWSRSMVVQPSVAHLAKWMTTDIGRIIMQFRMFAASSWTKQTLHNLQQRDMAAFLTLTNGMIVGGLAYLAQQYVASLGRKDAAEYRKRTITLGRFLKAGFQRAGASSLLPVMANEATNLVHSDQPFNYRNSGLEADPIFGNPTFDVIVNRGKALAGILRAPLDENYDFSQENMRALRALVPFQNAVGIKKVLDAIQSRLPPRSKEE